jgi:hypothetical protein
MGDFPFWEQRLVFAARCPSSVAGLALPLGD